ncbi:MAG: hypothetical protein KDC33_06805 [Thermoleophilia bacterium]|nr:hypothetical protein [Thermoleophilia bacterium]
MPLFVSSSDIAALSLRVDRLQRTLDAVVAHLDVDVPADPIDEELREMVRAGRPIDAIKRYREHSGAGLAESKLYLDGLGR